MKFKRYTCFIVALGISSLMMAQDVRKVVSHTFEVDGDLPPINKEMSMMSGDKICSTWAKEEGLGKVVAASLDKNSSLYLPQQSVFFNCMVEAFAKHYSVTLSPDIIWTLISQGFSHYINLDPEKYRDKLVNHEGKMEIVVQSAHDLYSPEVEWNKILSGFDKQIAANTKGNVADMMRADFSTTGTTELITSQVMLMSTVKAYFDFTMLYAVCGIPSITIEGTPDDWRKIIKKTEGLRNYDLGWWVDELTPILKEFVKAAKGNANRDFWRDIVKKDRPKEMEGLSCADIFEGKDPICVDGWFLKLIPFSKSGRTPEEVDFESSDILPNVASAPFTYKVIDETGISKIPMTIMAGLVGIDIDEDNRFMRPKVGWIVCEGNEKSFKDKVLEGQELRVDKMPEKLKDIDYLPKIGITFKDSIVVPEWMSTVKIDYIHLTQFKASTLIELKLKKLFPDRDVHVISDSDFTTCHIKTKQSFAPDDFVFTSETMLRGECAKFPGGYDEYEKYVDACHSQANNPKNLPQENVWVEFIVEKDGSITNISPTYVPDEPEYYEEAKRIIIGMPKWEPAYFENKDGSKRYFRFKGVHRITVF